MASSNILYFIGISLWNYGIDFGLWYGGPSPSHLPFYLTHWLANAMRPSPR